MIRAYTVYAMMVLGLYGLASWRGWEIGSSKRGFIPAGVRQSPGPPSTAGTLVAILGVSGDEGGGEASRLCRQGLAPSFFALFPGSFPLTLPGVAAIIR